MPSRWSLLLSVRDPGVVRPEQLYGLIAGWIEAGIDDTGHHAPRKPYTLSPLRPLPGRPAGHVAIDVGFLDDDLAARLLAAAGELVAVSGRLGRQAVRCLPWPDGRIGRLESAADWADLATERQVGDQFSVRLLSPTAFRSGRIHLPFPLPGLVLGHLREQWTRWGPDVAHPSIDDCDVAVVDYRLDCIQLTLRGRPVVASVGEVTYRVGSRDVEHRRAIGRWLALLPFASVGADTRMGLGQAEAHLIRDHRVPAR
ncbi:MAG: CRISPR system precrRNA processing endoribonuclease RAMP protein Cas6 [Actinobacteria bacterium]|nr:CRISPR system precrRNA processing endoribonuclease RAMP protein Cas6 [Actinomycetota bacterium]MBI3686163.1 CRISPR system precrRNA processing endoribonuclease RAMP protein Cas6 [Actinomycetota bacterium]